MPAVQGEEDVGVEVAEGHRNRPALPADPPLAELQILGRHESSRYPVHGVEALREIDVLGDVPEGLLLGDDGDQAGIRALQQPVGLDEHAGKTHHRVEEGVIEVQVETEGTDPVEAPPDLFADDLGYALVVPPSRAAEIPLGMVPEKRRHISLPDRIFRSRSSNPISP